MSKVNADKRVVLKRAEATKDDNNGNARKDAGEPGKADLCKSKLVRSQTKKDGSNDSGRGDTTATQKVVENNREENKVKYSSKCSKRRSKESIRNDEEIDNKIKEENAIDSNVNEAKYNKIVSSINKIILENIDLINTKERTDIRSEDDTDHKVSSKINQDNRHAEYKLPQKYPNKKEIAKVEDKALLNFGKKITNTKSLKCKTHDVSNVVNDIKNKSLIIKTPKPRNGYKLQKKPKQANGLSKKAVENTQLKLNFQQSNASETTDFDTKRDATDILTNERNAWATKIQTVAKDNTKKPNIQKIPKLEHNNFYRKKTALRDAKVKNVTAKKVNSARNRSQTKMTMLVDEHTKLYYEAWVNNTVTISAQDQQLEDSVLRRPSDSVETEIAPDNYADKKFTGTIKIKCGKNVK